MSLRARIYLMLGLLLVLMAVLGGTGMALIYRLGGRADAILRENYESVRAMERLNEALERIDSSFQFALAGKEEKARKDFDDNWPRFNGALEDEQHNITILPEEERLVRRLEGLRDRYRKWGDAFYALPPGSGARHDAYFNEDEENSLLRLFREIKDVATAILRLNQQNMEDASRDARETATASLIGLAGGLTVATLLAGVLAWRLVVALVGPVATMTDAARAVAAGKLDRTVSVPANDELGELARAFNLMLEQLRGFRRTNLHRLMRAREAAQATVDTFPDPVLLVDPEGRVELANPAALRVLGVAAPADGQPPAPWQPPEALREPLAAALREQRPTLTESFDQAVFFRLDGADRAYLPQVRPVQTPQGETLGAAVVLNDVTSFRLLDQLKGDLVATVSHELKTPLSSVRLALHLLLEEVVGPLNPKQIELLVDARDNAERLLSLVEHLLAMARLEHAAAAFRLSPEDPAALLRAAADAVAARAQGRGIALTVDIEGGLPPIAADAERLGLALNNLLDNALTYTEPGGTVTLSASAVGDDKVRLTVADTGAGIPPEYLPYVFERFFRVPNSPHPPGTGLGLAIVREVVLAHHGTATCESEPGKGTKFHLTLPVWSNAECGMRNAE
jgi:signal transduction histidine kinase/HAMP domain-containing protein